MAVKLNVWYAKEPRSWEKGAEDYETSIACSDGFLYEHDTLDDAYAALDLLERDPHVVEVNLDAPAMGRCFRRDAAGDLVMR